MFCPAQEAYRRGWPARDTLGQAHSPVDHCAHLMLSRLQESYGETANGLRIGRRSSAPRAAGLLPMWSRCNTEEHLSGRVRGRTLGSRPLVLAVYIRGRRTVASHHDALLLDPSWVSDELVSPGVSRRGIQLAARPGSSV